MRILFVVEFFPLRSGGIFEITGGLEAAALACARWVAKGHTLRVLTDYRSPPREFTCEGIEVVQCGRLGGYTQSGGLLHRSSFQRAAVREGVAFRPDIVVGWNFIGYLPAHKIARKCGVPAIAWYADVWIGRWMKLFGLKGLLGEVMERRVLRLPWDRFIAISDFTERLLLDNGMPRDRVEVIPPIVDLAGVNPGTPEPYSIVVASRHVKYKRVDVAIRAVARLIGKYPGLKMNIVGDGPESTSLRALATELGIADRITWRGWLKDHADVLRVMSESALYINASQIEGFGISTIEAAGLGVPYVASDIPAIRYATHGGEGGILFEPGNDAACAAGIDAILGDSAAYQAKRADAMHLAERYSPGTLGPAFENTLNQAINARGRSSAAVGSEVC